MGNSESQPIRNVDKRTARRDNALQYNQAIWNYRADVLGPLQPPDLAEAELVGDAASGSLASVRVCIRRRPIFSHEVRAGEFDVLSCSAGRSIVVHDCRLRPDCRNLIINHTTFEFDRVFDEAMSSDTVYAAEVAPLVRQAAATSTPGTVLMYGQTGSGKTFTMSALQQRVAADLFAALDVAAGDAVSASYVEVGSTGVRDLLHGGASCQLLTDASGEVQPVPVVEVRVQGSAGLQALFDYGTGVRATAATGVHDASSRSHAIFRLSVQRASAAAGDVGSLTLVDLAGSEQRIDSDQHDARRAREGAAINASLLALKDSIVTLATDGQFRSTAGGRHPLTQLLRASFEPGSRTTVLATVSPSSKDTEHTLNTLRHACVMHGQQQQGAQPGVQGATGGQLGPVYIRGGQTETQHVGEIDVAAARKRLMQEEARRAGDGQGVFRKEFGELYPADIRKQERQAAAAALRLQKKAMAQLQAASAAQAAALIEALEATARGLGLNMFQSARLQHRIKVKHQVASAGVRAVMRDRAALGAATDGGAVGEDGGSCRAASGRDSSSGCGGAEVDGRPATWSPAGVEHSSSDSDGPSPPRAKRAAQRARAQAGGRRMDRAAAGGPAGSAEWSCPSGGGEGLDWGESGSAALNRTKTSWDHRGGSEPAHAGAAAAHDGVSGPRYGRRSTPPTNSALPLSEQPVETAAAARERAVRDRAIAGGRRPPLAGVSSARPEPSADSSRRQRQLGRRGSSPHSRPVSAEAEPELPRSAYDEKKEAAAGRRAVADRERKAAILRRLEDRSGPAEVSDGSGFANAEGGYANEAGTYAERCEAAGARRAAADAARREAIAARLRASDQPHATEWADDALVVPSVYEERRQAALTKKAAAEAVRVDAISSRASRHTRAGTPETEFDEAELYAPTAAEEKQHAAAARRAAAEAARREALLAKLAVGGGATTNPLGPSADHRAEAARVEAAIAALPSDASQATLMGLRKQLATHRAALIREQRKREQAEREAHRKAEAQNTLHAQLRRQEHGSMYEEEEGQ